MGKLFTTSALLLLFAVYMMIFDGSKFDPEAVRDQRVLITGASSGIGEQLAYQYASLGARLVITARRADLLSDVSKRCEQLGARQVSFLAADMGEPQDRRKVIEYVEKYLGGLDHLVLNHAFMLQGWWLGNANNMTVLEKVHRVNFISFVDLASRALPMLTASRGRIGVVSSGFGEVGSALVSVYSSTKFALNGFFSSFRQEMRYKKTGVSVTLVALGPVSSDTMLSLSSEIMNLPTAFMATPSASARAILESVVQRRYKTYFDWKMWILSILNSNFPVFLEDGGSDIILETNGTWSSRLAHFLLRTFY